MVFWILRLRGAICAATDARLGRAMNKESVRRRAFLLGRPQRPDIWRAVLWFAVLLALPLVVFGIFAAFLIDADYAVTRTREVAQAAQKAKALGAVANNAINDKAHRAVAQIRDALGASDVLRNVRVAGFVNEVRFIFVHIDDGNVLPLAIGTLQTENELMRRLGGGISEARDELSNEAGAALPKAGIWTIGDELLSFVYCERDKGKRDICVAFDEITLDPVLEVALDAATAQISDRLIVLRDPAGRALWSHGPTSLSTSTIAELSGSMRGWHMETSTPAGTHQGLLPLTAITIPLIGCWLILVWYMYRNQQARLMESTFRSEMTAKLSHDLRTPIANLRLYAELLARRADDEVAVQRYSNVMSAEIDRLALLADNTIVYGRTAAPAPIRLDDAVPDVVLDSTIERYRNLFAATGSTIEVSHDAPRAGHFDRMGFERILINLLDNACKYAPGRIEVATHESDGMLSLSVRDHGSGLDPDSKNKVLAPRRAGAGAKDGFGLGLVVVRELAQANDGALTIEAADPGVCLTASLKFVASAQEPKCPS
jgi:signal transduction histidine kinase